MRSFNDIAKNMFANGGFEVMSVETCPKCGVEIKTVKTRIIGGPNKGKEEIIVDECHCRLAKETIKAEQRTKINFYKQFWTLNNSLKDANLDNFEKENGYQKGAWECAYEFLETLTHGEKPARKLFSGEPGLGKSHLALGICRQAEEYLGMGTMFIELPTLKEVLKASFGKDAEYTSHEIMQQLGNVDLLVLDDLGAEGITDWTREIVFTILNSRMGKHLLVTSNLSKDEIYAEYGAKTLDRLLAGMEKKDIAKFGGESYRLKKFKGE